LKPDPGFQRAQLVSTGNSMGLDSDSCYAHAVHKWNNYFCAAMGSVGYGGVDYPPQTTSCFTSTINYANSIYYLC